MRWTASTKIIGSAPIRTRLSDQDGEAQSVFLGGNIVQRTILLSVVVLLVLLTAGCLPGQGSYSDNSPAGFLSGIWHGWIAPLTLIGGLFSGVRIYEPVNNGWWYDFGFYMAVIGGFGGLTFTRRRRG